MGPEFDTLMRTLAFGLARSAPIWLLLPGFGVLGGLQRSALAMLLGAALLPPPALPALEWSALLRESGIGLLLGCALAWPFWVVQAWGAIADNARGATLGASFDPFSGADSGALTQLLSVLAAAVFLRGGGAVLIVDLLARSYRLCAPGRPCTLPLQSWLELLGSSTAGALRLASPLLGGALAADVLLGVLARLAPQLNPFMLALGLKSALVLALLLLSLSALPELLLTPPTLPPTSGRV